MKGAHIPPLQVCIQRVENIFAFFYNTECNSHLRRQFYTVNATKCAKSALKTVVKLSTAHTVLFHSLRQGKESTAIFFLYIPAQKMSTCMHAFVYKEKFDGGLRFNMGEN